MPRPTNYISEPHGSEFSQLADVPVVFLDYRDVPAEQCVPNEGLELFLLMQGSLYCIGSCLSATRLCFDRRSGQSDYLFTDQEIEVFRHFPVCLTANRSEELTCELIHIFVCVGHHGDGLLSVDFVHLNLIQLSTVMRWFMFICKFYLIKLNRGKFPRR